ncbi:MAG: beta-propeller domain-containing protein, partial [Limisphaerales bacterium]
MKTKQLTSPIVWTGLVPLLVLASSLWTPRAAEETSFARITAVRIESTNVVVQAEASTDFTKVTLESSTRLGRRAWQPRAVELITSSAAVENFTFSIPISPEIEILRVRGDRTVDTLPAEFYTGTNKFNVTGGTAGDGSTAGGDAGVGGPAAPNEGGDRGGDSQRSVVESDIWKLDGDTLFFFNQYRGLQVMDVSNPDAPEVSGTYDLPGAGEQMYVINGTNVVLLARDNCAWYGSDSSSRIVLLQVRNGEPHLVKELPVPGQIAESRLVGSALYVVANSYQRRTVPATDIRPAYEVWDWGSDIVSFDLSDLSTAEEKSRQWVRGYGNVIMATDKYLFVAQQNYDSVPYTSTIHSFDISAPTGTFAKLASFQAGGMVNDKFKMHVIDDDHFVVVVQIENWRVNQRSTHVRTFSFENPQAPRLLADLKIIENETLFATRFDGDRLYAVTFFRIDPLWIIDLSNPSAPKKLGELEIPGWSTFLQPLGDRLLAIGLDVTNGYSRTVVQLFDVADPADPTLMSKVFIGDQWSGSEANWDEKAFG